MSRGVPYRGRSMNIWVVQADDSSAVERILFTKSVKHCTTRPSPCTIPCVLYRCGHNGDRRIQHQKRTVAFIGFGPNHSDAPSLHWNREIRHTAYNGGWIDPRVLQNVATMSRSSLAMRACDSDAYGFKVIIRLAFSTWNDGTPRWRQRSIRDCLPSRARIHDDWHRHVAASWPSRFVLLLFKPVMFLHV